MTADRATVLHVKADGEVTQTWPPVPVGCACRQEDQDPLGCAPEYDMPGVGAVVPLNSYLAVVAAMRGDDLHDLEYEAPPGTELVGFYCFRGGGHICEESCKSDSVPLFAQAGWAAHVRRSIRD